MHWNNYLIFFIIFYVTSADGYVSRCVKSGVKCADCEHLNLCIQTPRGMNQYQLNFCNNSLGEYCSEKEGGCSLNPTSCRIFGLRELACQNSSIFPDPYDCTTYHQCVEQPDGSLTSIKHTCSEDRAYDSLTGSCRFKPNHRVCRDSPVPACIFPMQTDSLKENPSIFYFCIKQPNGEITPLLYRCRNGEEYKAAAHACVEVKDPSVNAFSCAGEGTFIDPSDSRKYFKCLKDKTFIHESCKENEYFDLSLKSCWKMSHYMHRSWLDNNFAGN